MNEDECRLTYKEGREIEKDAYEPYSKRAHLIVTFGFAIFIGTAGIALLSMNFDHFLGDDDDLDDLLKSGEISEGWYEYERNKTESQTVMLGMTTFLMTAISAVAISMIGDIERKKALKKANDERRDKNAEDGKTD